MKCWMLWICFGKFGRSSSLNDWTVNSCTFLLFKWGRDVMIMVCIVFGYFWIQVTPLKCHDAVEKQQQQQQQQPEGRLEDSWLKRTPQAIVVICNHAGFLWFLVSRTWQWPLYFSLTFYIKSPLVSINHVTKGRTKIPRLNKWKQLPYQMGS